ncbi:cytochrome P450 [Aspergillus tetrazonus]
MGYHQPGCRRYVTIDYIRRFAKELIDAQGKSLSKNQDMMNTLINGRDPKTGRQISEESILDNIVTFHIAGHEKTSGGIAFLLYHLVESSEAWQKVQKKVNAVVGNGRITPKHPSMLRYTTACVRESLRLWPKIPVIAFNPKINKSPQ